MRWHVLTLSSVLLLVPWVAAADDWEELAKILDRYYYLDGGPLARVDCAVRVPFLNAMLAEARRALPSEAVEIRETLDAFRISFDAEAGLSFDEPRLEVIAPDTTSMTDPKKFQEGATSLEQNFAKLIGNVEQMLKVLFTSYVRPKRKHYADVKVERENGKIRVHYRIDGSDAAATIEHGSRHTLSSSDAGTLEVMERYEPSGEKSRFASATLFMKGPMHEMTTEMNVEYQELAGRDFPFRLVFKTHARVSGGFTQGSEIDIRLEDCRVQ